MITVYSQPKCAHCTKAIEYLTENTIPFRVVDIRADAEALAFIQAEGHKTTPQLYVGNKLLVANGNAGVRTMSRDEILEKMFAFS